MKWMILDTHNKIKAHNEIRRQINEVKVNDAHSKW